MGPESGDQPFLPLLEKANKFPALSDKNWLCDFAFAVDIFSYLNELNVKLRGERSVGARHVKTCTSLQI